MTDITEFNDEQLTEELRASQDSKLEKTDNQTSVHDLPVHEIEQARDRYRDLYDISPIGYVSFDQHGCVQEINLTACQMLGRERANIVGNPFILYLPKPNQPDFLNHIAEVFRAPPALANTKKVTTEIELSSFGQTPVYVRLESIAVTDKLANTITCRTAVIDISDSVTTQQDLGEQRDFAENIIETAASIVLMLDAEGKILRVNSFFEKLTGYSRKELIGNDWFDTFIPGSKREQLRERYAKARQGERVAGFIASILTKSGDEKIIEWHAAEQRDCQGRLTSMLGIGLDITARIDAEMAIYESQEQIRLLIDAVQAVIAYVDSNRWVRFHNRHCTTWLSVSDTEINDKSMAEVFGEAAYDALLPLVNTAMAGEQVSASLEVPLSLRNKRFVVANFVPEFTRDGSVKGFFVLLNDITDYRREETVMKQRLASLAQESRVNMMGEMASEIAHELNQPLAAISNYADACLRLQKLGKLQGQNIIEVLNEIKGEAKRANQIIRHVRDFTQKRELHLQLVDVNELIKDVLQLVVGELNWQDAVVDTHFSSVKPMVVADGVLLKQVFLNLINNANEVMAVSNIQNRRIKILSLVKDRKVLVEVDDNGPGVSEELTGVIFKPFFTTKPDGMGLGLSMCQSIVESHGGSIQVRQKRREGASFCVSLPLAPGE